MILPENRSLKQGEGSLGAAPGELDTGSYGHILRSSSIIGGAQAINLLIGMIKTKLVAILLGPAGVGLVTLYQSATSVVGIISNFGISSSAVRQVAQAVGSEEKRRLGVTVKVLRRACWISGLLGAVITAILAWPLSVWTFGRGEHAGPIAILGITLLFASISTGQLAIIQGIRRIRDLALFQILSVIAGTILSLGIYWWLGRRGIVPVLIVTAAVNLGLSSWLVRRVAVSPVHVTWKETISEVSHLITLGLAFMWSALLVAGVGLAIRALIVRKYGLDANGIYQAAWGISGAFAAFILSAMGTDLFPRLTAVAKNNAEVNQLVNEQTEIGILLALPGLLATLAFSPLAIRIFYSGTFDNAAELLPWFVIGVFGRVISWPLGFIQLAKGSARWFAISETSFSALHIALVWIAVRWLGLVGVAISFSIAYVVYTFGMIWVSKSLSEFRWTRHVLRLIITGAAAILLTFLIMEIVMKNVAEIAGCLIFISASLFCLRQISHRLGSGHRITGTLSRLPILGRYFHQ